MVKLQKLKRLITNVMFAAILELTIGDTEEAEKRILL